MPKLPVVENVEREKIRAQLKRYMKQHGIGAPRLYERMSYVLDRSDNPYVDLRSLQRFLRNEVRTDDEKVIRYRRFLSIAAPAPKPTPAAIFAELIRQNTLLPTDASIMDATDKRFSLGEVTGRRPLSEYVGRYAVSVGNYGEEPDYGDVGPNAEKHIVCLPDPSGMFLLVTTLARSMSTETSPDDPNYSAYTIVSVNALMVPMGSADLLIVELDGLGDGGSFTLFRDISLSQPDGRTTLEGVCLYTIGALARCPNVCTERLTRIDG
ncbi:hypothetical protein [Roseovarius ramblicola]|uniref:Uncharacterized protein n=1 Tax=Roseovarius ramblicola TaxID=2022336 RepID=A0ABV5I4N0_9RHOB